MTIVGFFDNNAVVNVFANGCDIGFQIPRVFIVRKERGTTNFSRSQSVASSGVFFQPFQPFFSERPPSQQPQPQSQHSIRKKSLKVPNYITTQKNLSLSLSLSNYVPLPAFKEKGRLILHFPPFPPSPKSKTQKYKEKNPISRPNIPSTLIPFLFPLPPPFTPFLPSFTPLTPLPP